MGKRLDGNSILKIALENPDIQVPPDVASLLGKGKGRNKYGAVRCKLDGMSFDSKAEMKRWGDLLYLKLTGAISELEFHPVFVLTAGVKYEADFRYIENGVVVVEDVKGGKATQTQVWRNKWKQVQVLYPEVEFRVVEK